jgi:CAAX prenyl protease N-terminal, five membrane helices
VVRRAAQWLGDAALRWLITTVFTVVGLVLIIALIRRKGRGAWVAWAGGVYAVLSVVSVLITPQYIAPLVNHITPMADSPRKQAILSLARANGVPANDVFVQDASRQTVLLNAHVTGFGGAAQNRAGRQHDCQHARRRSADGDGARNRTLRTRTRTKGDRVRCVDDDTWFCARWLAVDQTHRAIWRVFVAMRWRAEHLGPSASMSK